MPIEPDPVGQSVARVDAEAKVTGLALYPGDLTMPGMLHMKTLFAERPHARVVRLDTSRAEKQSGVVAVFTAKDVPVNEFGLQQPDQPVLCGPGSGVPGSDVVRFVGDKIALVVADTEQIAAAARDLIGVEFEDMPIVTDPREAMQPGAPLIHPERGESNVCAAYTIRKGDVREGFAQAEVTVESEYVLPFQEHAYLQPEAGIAYLDEAGRVTVEVGGQWVHTDRKQIAHALNLPEDRVRVKYPAIGGAFGGREDISVQIVLALAALKLQRPVKTVWSRRESIIGHGKRHPMWLRAKWGATSAGKILAAEMEIVADAGAYLFTSNKVLANTTVSCTGPYSIPHVTVDSSAVYTNNVPTCALRGFGAPQGIFLAEMQMNRLAAALRIDPVELRMRNILTEGDTLSVGTPPPDPLGIDQVMRSAAGRAGWRQTSNGWCRPDKDARGVKEDGGGYPPSTVRRGFGFASGFKNVGFSFGFQENCWARIELHGAGGIEHAVVHYAGADVGQGAHTVVTQMAAGALGLPIERVELISSDTSNMGNAGSTSASRLTFMAGNAVRGAAESALERWRRGERPAIADYTYLAPPTTPFDLETGHSTPNFAYAYAAQAVEVEVDTETGVVRLLRVVAADDVGKAINPQAVEGQIEGAVVQAQGYALQEDFQMKDGCVITDQLSSYLIPTALDVPDVIETLIIEVPDPRGPWGARGLGEVPFLPLAPAILAAVHDATGIWLHELPATPARVLRALHTQ